MKPLEAVWGWGFWGMGAVGCSAGGAPAPAAPSVESERVLVGSLPSFVTPRRAAPVVRPPSPECVDGREEHTLIPVECSPTCTGHEVSVRYCVEGRFNSKTLAADCALCPAALPSGLRACRINRTTILPSELSRTDGCRLELVCGDDELSSECDGENDETGTSLCECRLNGAELRDVSNPVSGEAPDACLRAAEKCLASRRR